LAPISRRFSANGIRKRRLPFPGRFRHGRCDRLKPQARCQDRVVERKHFPNVAALIAARNAAALFRRLCSRSVAGRASA
jgi:hypothetical protein